MVVFCRFMFGRMEGFEMDMYMIVFTLFPVDSVGFAGFWERAVPFHELHRLYNTF